MTILQIILIVIGLGGLILAGVSLIAMQRGGEYSNIYSLMCGAIIVAVCGIVLLLAGCGGGTAIHDWHRSLQESVFRGQCWSDEGHGCYSKTIGTVSCVAILSGGVYHLSMGYYGIHDGGYRRECVLAVEAIQAFEHYAAQRDPYRWDQARADSMRLRFCGHRTEEAMREEAMKQLKRIRGDTTLNACPPRCCEVIDTLPDVPYDSLPNVVPHGFRLIRASTHQHGFRLIRVSTHQPEADGR